MAEDNKPIILHLDMDAFFASIEEAYNPSLRGKPIAVIGSNGRTVITSPSYPARAKGVKTGMNKYEAMKLCKDLLLIVGDNRRYTFASTGIMEILKDYTPMVEPYSIDEAFLDVTGVLKYYGGTAEDMAYDMKARIKREFHVTCSVGIGPNKLIAKLASKKNKPDGVATMMTDESISDYLEDLKLSSIWGIGKKTEESLNSMGVKTVGELGRFPVSLLRRRFGIVGENLSLMGRGIYNDPVVVNTQDDEVKSIGHSTTLPKDISDKKLIKNYMLKLSTMVSERARRYGYKGGLVWLTIRFSDFTTESKQRRLGYETDDTNKLYKEVCGLLNEFDLSSQGQAVRLIGVGMGRLTKGSLQLSLFEGDLKREKLLKAIDDVNSTFGPSSVFGASLLNLDDNKKTTSGVISPAWRPEGVRNVEVD